MVNVAADNMALYNSARAADPFNLDCYFRNEDPVVTQPPGALVDRLYPSRRMRALRGGVSQSAGAPVPVVTVDTERQVLSVDAERESTA